MGRNTKSKKVVPAFQGGGGVIILLSPIGSYMSFSTYLIHIIFYVPLAYILHLLESCRFSKCICFPRQFLIQRDSMCLLSLWRVVRGSKLMHLDLIHGLFIT
jgi:hypothetical protein